MELLVQRVTPAGLALGGLLTIDGIFEAFTMENAKKAIQPGRYRVLLTSSARAERHELWSPDRAQFRLPLVENVPGRSGIRFHALNEPGESEGCIGVGRKCVPGRILESRVALVELMAKIAAAPVGSVWLAVADPLKETPKNA
jgi:hypothetical protein